MLPEKIKVLYLAGVARSGSTLLGRLMGQPEEAVHVGEMVYIWQRSFREQHICGCGQTFQGCPFWQEVFERGFGGFHQVDFESLLATKRQMERTRTLPRLLAPWKTTEQQQQLDEYRRVLATLYRAIQETSGARIIIDGSKSEVYGYLLDSVPQLDVRGLHLVRDSRAVAHSHQRRKPDPAQRSQDGTLPATSPSRSALIWNVTNLLLAMKMPGSRSLRMRYEDVIFNPVPALQRLWAFMEEPTPPLDFLTPDAPFRLRANHTVAGNPDRFQREVQIRPDLEWQRKMPAKDRRLVTALTWPLLLRYGYLRPAASERAAPAPISSSCVL